VPRRRRKKPRPTPRRCATCCAGEKLRAVRARAVLAIGFAGAFRRSELVAIRVEGLRRDAEGIRVVIRRSKADQEGEGATVAIPHGDRLRPVAALDAWLSACCRRRESAAKRRRTRSGYLHFRRPPVLALAARSGRLAKAAPTVVSRPLRSSRMAACQPPVNAGLRPPPSAADGVDRGLAGSRWLLIEQRQELAGGRKQTSYQFFGRRRLAADSDRHPHRRPGGGGLRVPRRAGQVTDEPMSDRAVARLVQAATTAAGYAPVPFGGHSLRAGFITSAARTGAGIFKIQEISRHRSLQVLAGYVRDAQVYRDHAGSGFL